ncbi:NAD(P)/FAD-dependent oxidoreductase [Reyranella sp.]|uniref:NAD(P)/FAD-dependent oxidoreductase n=1 Tax=Reyranella sp. TaxID=1929291 RepID=UPI0037843DD0
MPRAPLDDSPSTPPSYWAATATPAPAIPEFDGSERADFVVVGAGYTGLSAALHLAERGLSLLVLDANEPGWGASGRNNGQVVAALKHEPHEIEEQFGKERGSELIRVVGQGPDLVFGLIERYGMQCDARRSGILTAAHSPASLSDLQRRVDVWRSRGAPLQMLSRAELESRSGTAYYFGGCLDPRGGAINPLGYARGLAAAVLSRGGVIRRGAHVRRIVRAGARWRLELQRGSVDADKVILGTNAYTDDLWPGLRKTFLPARTPQLVSRPLRDNIARSILPDGQIMSDTRYLTVGVRMHADGRMHLGGGNGTAGADVPALYEPLARQANILFPNLGDVEWEYRWTGWMAMTPDRYPRLFELAPNAAAALGYSGRGICTATIMGRELARWAAGEATIDELALPASSFRRLPYYALRRPLVDGAVLYHSLRDRPSRHARAS